MRSAGICLGKYWLVFWAAQMTSIINASLIVVLQPILFVVAAYFIFSEAFTKRCSLYSCSYHWRRIPCTGRHKYWNERYQSDLLVVVSVSIGAAYFVFGRKLYQRSGT